KALRFLPRADVRPTAPESCASTTVRVSRATPQRGVMHRITRRPSPAMGVALFALFFAMGGGAYAAKHYLITSTKQISPKVLKALKGKSGKIGPAGATGPAGPAGAAGVAGAKGDKGDIGPSTAYAAFHDDVIDISSKLVGSPATVATLG